MKNNDAFHSMQFDFVEAVALCFAVETACADIDNGWCKDSLDRDLKNAFFGVRSKLRRAMAKAGIDISNSMIDSKEKNA